MAPSDRRARLAPLVVDVVDVHGRRLRMNALSSWLERTAPVRACGTVNIALVSDRAIRQLNRTYRKHDTVTDVLSFSYARSPKPGARRRTPGVRSLGDIVIATGVARRQARAAGHSEMTELRVLALHGLLHLLGYDHDDARDDGTMKRVEDRLRRRGGLKTAGLIARARKQ